MPNEAMAQIAEDLKDNQHRMGVGEDFAKLGFAIALSKARKEAALTQQELASLLRVSQAYVARLESGDANPTIGKAGRIFAVLGQRLSLDSQPFLERAVPGRPGKGRRTGLLSTRRRVRARCGRSGRLNDWPGMCWGRRVTRASYISGL